MAGGLLTMSQGVGDIRLDLDARRRATMASLLEKLDELPVLPAVVVKLLELDPADESYFEDVLGVANEDAAFATRVLRAANSAESAPVAPIETLRSAVTRLGARRIGQLITSMAVMRVFIPTDDGQRLLWIHGLDVGVIARAMAELRPRAGVAPEAAYVMGLLHDIGRFILFGEALDDFSAVDEFGWGSPDELIEAEQKICGFDHAQLGFRACVKWGIPQAIAEFVRDHHDYSLAGAGEGAEPRAQLLAMVQMADFVSVLHWAQPDLFEGPTEPLVNALRERCVHPSWDEPPLPPELLAKLLPAAFEASARMARDLGVARRYPGKA